ncbi:ATP-binding protein [Georgenia sp. 10Sc9-8]|uniref:ATP-binding protein n=1 Tax=Georgenia halotolerans TaxID=3028317 RepID=A0ABT5U0R8_9MICO|nr:ATP-binding protein [Georgenia halotolerans]
MPGRSTSLAQTRPPTTSAPVGSWHIEDASELNSLRSAARKAVHRWRRKNPGGSDDHLAEQRLLLVVSELATNALKYGSEPISVDLHRVDDGWLVDTLDGNGTQPPVQYPPERGRIGRNGLLIIERASTTWGWYRDPADDRLKHVWGIVPDPCPPDD